MDSLPNDILREIYSRLPLINRKALAIALPRVAKLTTAESRDTHAEIAARLGDLCDRVIFAGGSFTGGFLLDCLHGTDFAGDIDIIFSAGVENTTFRAESYYEIRPIESEFKEKAYLYHSFMRELYANGFSVRGEASDNKIIYLRGERLCAVRRLSDRSRSLDIIVADTPAREHVAKYDLDFCKVFYDGRLHMPSLGSTLRRESRINARYARKMRAEYEGLSSCECDNCAAIREADQDDQLAETYCLRVDPETYPRAVKYRSRGYKVTA